MRVIKNNPIQYAIRMKNMTSKEAAEAMNMNPGKLTQLKTGQRPNYENYMKLRDFGISEKELRKHFEGR